MSILTDFYHKLPSGETRRIALAPLVRLDELRGYFADLALYLSQVTGGDSYAALWETSPKFRRCVEDILTINGMAGIPLTLGDRIALTIGTGRAPLLAEYNLITDGLTPSPLPDNPPTGEPPPQPRIKRLGDVFPCFGTDGGLLYPRGVTAANHGEFEATYGALTAELVDMQSLWALPHPAIALLWSEEVRALALRLIELFGLPPGRLNVHQVCELAIAYQDQPGLLPQLAGLIDFADAPPVESVGTPIPRTHSIVHFLSGALSHAGVKDWRSLIEGLTMTELESYQQGVAWALDGGESARKKRDAEHRRNVFERRILKGGEDPMLQSLRRRKKGIGL